jgi:hypothetical protein
LASNAALPRALLTLSFCFGKIIQRIFLGRVSKAGNARHQHAIRVRDGRQQERIDIAQPQRKHRLLVVNEFAEYSEFDFAFAGAEFVVPTRLLNGMRSAFGRLTWVAGCWRKSCAKRNVGIYPR